MPGLTVNGVDLRSLNLYLQGMPAFDDAPSRQVATVSSGSQFGAYVSRIDGGGARKLQIEAAVVRDSVVNRVTTVQNVKALCDGGLSRLALDLGGGSPIRLLYGYLDGEPSWQSPRSFRSGVTLLKTTFTCPNPLWQAVAGRPVALAAANTRYALEVGTGATPFIARIMGPATTPYFYIRDAWGNIKLWLQFPTLTSTEYIDFDSRRAMLEKVSSGVRMNQLVNTSVLAGQIPFAIDQSMGDYAHQLYPLAEVSAGTGEVLYVERFS